MKLALFSLEVKDIHIQELQALLDKPLSEVKFLYINTPGNYKPYKSSWMIESENKWRSIFPSFQEFDLERAYRVDNVFDFKSFISEYDFFYVSGGNTFILSYWMEVTGVREILREMVVNNQIVYGGESAGSVYAYKDISAFDVVDDKTKAQEVVTKGLDLTELPVIPHWGNKDFESGLLEISNTFTGKDIKPHTISDTQALFVNDSDIKIL